MKNKIWKIGIVVGQGHPMDQLEKNWGVMVVLLSQLLAFFGSKFADGFAKLAEGASVTNLPTFKALVESAYQLSIVDADGMENPGILPWEGPLAMVPDLLKEKLGIYWKPICFYESHSGKTCVLVGYNHTESELTVVLLMDESSSFLYEEGGQASIVSKIQNIYLQFQLAES